MTAPSRSEDVQNDPLASTISPAGGSAARARVVIADDSPPFLELLGDLVRRTAGLEVVAEATSGDAAVRLADERRPDMVILDVNMPGLDGIGAARQIKACEGSVLAILISTLHPQELPAEAHEVADVVLCKADLEPALLDRLRQDQRRRPSDADAARDEGCDPGAGPPPAC